jgi:hypothetical protein
MSLFGKIKEKFSSGATQVGQGISKGSKVIVKQGMSAGRQVAGKVREEIHYQQQLKSKEDVAYRTSKMKYASKFGQVRAKQEYQHQVARPQQSQGLGQGMTFLPTYQPNVPNRHSNNLPVFEMHKPQTVAKKKPTGKRITIHIG